MRFELFSPYSPGVALVASWSRHPIPLQPTSSGIWQLETEVPDGPQHYRFRTQSLSPFLRGRTITVADPLGRAIDKANGATRLLMEQGRDTARDYPWQYQQVPLPQNHQLVIYELHVREFAQQGRKPGSFMGLVERLDYLRDLGVNALQLMPISAFPGEASWGYNPQHFCAPEPSYGSPQELKYLIDQCHRRGMRVLLDMVFNHSDTHAPLTQLDFYYWYRNPRKGELSFGPKLDYERYDPNLRVFPARRFALEVARYWMQEYQIDGFRLDATKVLDNFDFLWALRRLAEQTVQGKPFYLVAEHIPEDPAIAGPMGPAHGAWHHRFYGEVVGQLTAQHYNLEALAHHLQAAHDGYARPDWVVNYLQTHDELPLMRRLGQAGIFAEDALRLNKLGATLLFTAVGNPMLAQGQEWGDHRPKSLKVRRLRWAQERKPYGQGLKAHYRHLAGLRSRLPGLQSSDFALVLMDKTKGLLAFRRGTGTTEVYVLVNLSPNRQVFALPFPTGHWHELLYNYSVHSQQSLQTELGPQEAKIFARQPSFV